MRSPKENPARRRDRTIWPIFLVACLSLGMLIYFAVQPGARQAPRPTPGAPTALVTVKVFDAVYVAGDLKFTSEQVDVPPGLDPKLFAVNRTLARLGITPPGSDAVSCRVEGATARLDFDRAFARTYGTDDEGAILNGVLRAMGQFPDVERVQFLVGGSPIETLGNVEITEPQPVIR